jgi:hypothetical protein
MLNTGRYTRKEDKYILETYDLVKDDRTKSEDVFKFIGAELNRSWQGVAKRHQLLRRKLKSKGVKLEKKPRYVTKHKPKLDYYGAVSAVMTMIIVALVMYIVFGG